MTRPTPDTVAPQLDGADERDILVDWLDMAAISGEIAANYRSYRDGYELADGWYLPARVPRALRELLGRRR